jgi:hypothetical protein
MNIQDILRKGGTKLSTKLDVSELYDYELIDVIIGKVDAVLDYSEYYDYELLEIVIGKVDATLDYSEFYDYTIGDNTMDYIYVKIVVITITGKVLITDDNFIITTDDNYMIEYV